MFILNLNKFGREKCTNYPKYLVFLKDVGSRLFHDRSTFYYLISFNEYHINIMGEIPIYLIVIDLCFDRSNKNTKFDLSRLGTDYLVNKLCIHFKDECIGSYPDNYIFVNEPVWPDEEIYKIDKTPLKRS